MTDNPREQQLERLETAIEEAHQKVANGRVRKAENERVRIKWIRALSKLVESHRKVLNDHREAELEARLDNSTIDSPRSSSGLRSVTRRRATSTPKSSRGLISCSTRSILTPRTSASSTTTYSLTACLTGRSAACPPALGRLWSVLQVSVGARRSSESPLSERVDRDFQRGLASFSPGRREVVAEGDLASGEQVAV